MNNDEERNPQIERPVAPVRRVAQVFDRAEPDEPGDDETERGRAHDHEQRSEQRAAETAGVEHERHRDDRRDVGERHPGDGDEQRFVAAGRR